jgi:hypothetical protein
VHADGRSCRPVQRHALRRTGAEITGEAVVRRLPDHRCFYNS